MADDTVGPSEPRPRVTVSSVQAKKRAPTVSRAGAPPVILVDVTFEVRRTDTVPQAIAEVLGRIDSDG
jgi:hypothetical protein